MPVSSSIFRYIDFSQRDPQFQSDRAADLRNLYSHVGSESQTTYFSGIIY
jgi:hypothetical protein